MIDTAIIASGLTKAIEVVALIVALESGIATAISGAKKIATALGLKNAYMLRIYETIEHETEPEFAT